MGWEGELNRRERGRRGGGNGNGKSRGRGRERQRGGEREGHSKNYIDTGEGKREEDKIRRILFTWLVRT